MRIAILIVSIIGAVICLGLGGYQVACAGCAGSCAAAASEASTAENTIGESNASGNGDTSLEDMASVMGTVAFANLLSAIGLILQAILGVAGGIVTFSRLGAGLKAKKGAILLSAAVGITVLAHLIGIIMVLNIDESIFPAKEQGVIGFVVILVAGALLHGIATVMAFLAEPNQVLPPTVQSPTNNPTPSV